MLTNVQLTIVLTVSSGGAIESTVLNSLCHLSGFKSSMLMVSSVGVNKDVAIMQNLKEKSKPCLKWSNY